MIMVTIQEFKEYDGRDLTAEINADGSDEVTEANRFLQICSRKIYNYIRTNSTRQIRPDDELTSHQKEALKEAICEYGSFILENGDVDIFNDVQIKMPSHIHQILKTGGLITTSFGRRNSIYGDYL